MTPALPHSISGGSGEKRKDCCYARVFNADWEVFSVKEAEDDDGQNIGAVCMGGV